MCLPALSSNRLTFFSMLKSVSINLVNVVAIFLRIIFLMVLGLRASKNIFRNLLEVVMYAPMSFFDTTPIGRVVNRFSQDMYTIDSQLMTALRSYLVRATVISFFTNHSFQIVSFSKSENIPNAYMFVFRIDRQRL